MTKLIQPVEIVRDQDGYGYHPDEPDFEEGQEQEFRDWIASQGLEIKLSRLEDEHESHPAYNRYFEIGDADIHEWEASPPAGEGWFTLSIHDTDDGPVWVWARRIADKPSDEVQS